MSRRFVVVLPLLVVLVLAACGGGGTSGGTSPSGTVSPSGHVVKVHVPLGKGITKESVAMKVGDTLEVTLESNASTGYTWSQEGQFDMTVLEAARNTSQGPESPVPGAPGTQTYRFKALAPGSTGVILTYARPFENKKPVQTLDLTVKVT